MPFFTFVRKSTIVILALAVTALAFLGILSIWEVLEKEDVFKSLTSIGVLAFAGFLIILIALEREGKLWEYFSKETGHVSPGRVITTVLVVMLVLWWVLGSLGNMW